MPYIPTPQELNAIPTAPLPGGSSGGPLPSPSALLTSAPRAASPAPYVPTQSEMEAIPSVRPAPAVQSVPANNSSANNSSASTPPIAYQPVQAELDAIPNAPAVLFSPAYDGTTPDAKNYVDPDPKNADPIGHAFLAMDTAGQQYQAAPTPENKTAYQSAVQGSVNALTSSPTAPKLPQYAQFIQDAAKQGLAPPPAAQAPQSNPSGPMAFAERIIGADGHEGTFHQQLDSLGSTAASLWHNLNSPNVAPSGPGQYADVAADTSNAEGADTLLSRMNQQAAAQAPAVAADLVVPGGHTGLLAHGAEAALHGTLPEFGKSLGPGIENETLNNPVGQMMNVIALVSAAKIPMDVGASGLLGAGGKLSAMADAAETAGNTASAANLRSLAQKAVAAGQDMKVASAQYGRTVTGGSAGDAALNAAATIARKHFPSTGLADELTSAAMSRSLGKAVVDAYPGYKVMRDMDQGRITPQEGDVNIGAAGMTQTGGAAMPGAGNTPAPVGSGIAGLGAVPRPALPMPSPSVAASPLVPPASAPNVAAPSPVPAPALPSAASAGPAPLSLPPASAPLSLAGKPLDASAPLTSGAARHMDGTFAPVPSVPRLPLSKVPQATTGAQPAPLAPNPPADARLVSGFPVSQLYLDPDRFQYKIGYGKGGSSGSLTDAKAFNPDFAGVVHAWRDPADGKAYVVNGHNRVGLAQRTGTAGIDARFIDAPDAASARTRGALINIAEGQGSALDAAKVFRENGYTPASLQKIGVNLSGQKATQGLALASLSVGLFSQAMRGQLPVERAAIIGGTLPDHGDQATLVKQIGEKNVTNDDVREMAEAIVAGPKHTSQTSSLFGTDEITSSLAIERAQASSYIKAQLGKDASALSGAAKNADRLKAGNNVIDAETSQRLATAHRQGAEIFDATKNAPGEVSDILNGAAKRIAQAKDTGEHVDAIKQDALRQFQQYAGQHFGSAGSSQPAGELFGTNNDTGPGGSVSTGAGGGADPRPSPGSAEPSGGGVRPGSGVYEGDGSRGRLQDGRTLGQTRDRQPLTTLPALTADGRQVALKGKSGTLYVGAQAYTDLTDRLGASGTSQGLTLRPEHARQVNLALLAATRDYQRGFPARANTPEGKQYVADLNRTANLIKQGIGGKAGLSVVKVEPGQTLSQTKAVARHEKTHAASYSFPLSQASRDALTTSLSDPAHPLHEAFSKAQAALTARGYAPEKTWDEIPAVISGGPTQYEKMGLSAPQAEGLLREYAKRLASEHGPEAVRAVFAHGSATARQVAANPPAKVPLSKTSARPQATENALSSPDETGSPDEMRLLTLDEVTDIRKAGLLSSGKTIIKAVAAHGAALASDEIARLPASLTDFLVSAATGRDRTIGDVRVQDIAAAAKVGASQGIRLGFQVMKDGAHGLATKGVTNPMLPANHAPFHSGNRILDAYVNTIFNAHEGAYAALRMFALHRALLEMADVGSINAVRRGLIPPAQKENFRQHLYNAPSSTMMAAAVSAAEEATLTNPNKFSEMYQGAYDKAPPVGRALMSQVTPFPKIESNVSGRALEMAGGAVYAPMQFALKAMSQNGFTANDQQRFARTFGRGLVGLGLIALGMMIGAKKRGQVSDEKHHQPGAIISGGKSYPTNTVAPASNLLQLGIDLQAAREDAGTGTGPSVGDAVRNLLMEQPWAQANPGDLTQVLSSGKDAKKQLGQQLGSYVPAILADAAAQGDKFKRKQAEPLDFVKDRIPGLRQTLPVATDTLGNPRLEAPNRMFNPFGGTPLGASGTPAMQALQQGLSDKQDGVLTPAQQASLAFRKSTLADAAAGKDIRPAVQSALDSRQITPGQARHLMLESQMTTLQQKADLLPLGSALDVYGQATTAERVQLQPVLMRKLAGAARSRILLPADVQRAQALGIGAGN